MTVLPSYGTAADGRHGTLKNFTLWCEGPNDIPVFESFIQRISTPHTAEIRVRDVGGWTNALNPNRDPASFLDGCFDCLVVLDGDEGRDYSKPDHPLSKNAKTLKARLASANVDLKVLGKYGIENYFSQKACEFVFAQDLSAYFPLPVDAPIQTHFGGAVAFSKKLNGQIAEAMQVDELAGTDLFEFLNVAEKRARLD